MAYLQREQDCIQSNCRSPSTQWRSSWISRPLPSSWTVTTTFCPSRTRRAIARACCSARRRRTIPSVRCVLRVQHEHAWVACKARALLRVCVRGLYVWFGRTETWHKHRWPRWQRGRLRDASRSSEGSAASSWPARTRPERRPVDGKGSPSANDGPRALTYCSWIVWGIKFSSCAQIYYNIFPKNVLHLLLLNLKKGGYSKLNEHKLLNSL